MSILSRTLVHTRYARLWALSFAIYTFGWALIAIIEVDLTKILVSSVLFNIAFIAGFFTYLGGFLDRHGRVPIVRLASAAAITFVAQTTLMALQRKAAFSLPAELFLPAVWAMLYATAAMLVTPGDRQVSATERSVIGMLICLSISNLALIALAIAERGGLVLQGTFLHIAAFLGTPTTAALGLFTLMLIASDFSRERLRLIHTDPLTGILNRSGLERSARRMMARARPPRRPVTLILADIDRFKSVNDLYGHLTGDSALIVFAHHLVDAMPRGTLVGRFGGEEFAMLVDGHDAEAAAILAESVRANLAHLSVPRNSELKLTASFGVAEMLPGETLVSLYARADAALYLSKQEGRNRTSIDPGRAA